MKPIIEVKNLSKSYLISHQKVVKKASALRNVTDTLKKPLGGGGPGYTKETFWALKDVSFDVQQGEIFGIVGRNGSGKSTLLKILSRIVDPTKGEITMRGKVASLLEVGTGFHPELTGRENIFLNGSMLGLSRRDIISKFNEIVEFSEVERFLDTPVKFYSSGMYVRLAFSVAAHLEPDILILDEVLSVGDAAFQKKSLNKIMETMRAGKTVIFVSHSMASVQQLCNRGMLLNEGKVVFIGDTAELASTYLDLVRSETPIDNTASKWIKNGTEASNDYFVLESLILKNDMQKSIANPVRGSSDTWVEFTLDIKKVTPDLMIGYAIYRSRSLLYFSYFNDKPSLNKIKLRKGINILRGKIPKYLLNEGEYKVAIVASIHNKFWIYDPTSNISPSVGLQIEGGLIHEEYWSGAREGVLAPMIVWENRAEVEK